MSKSLTGTIVTQYLEKFPDIGKLTIARKIFTENKKVFNSIDHARGLVKHYTGANGKKQKAGLNDKRFVGNNKYSIPKSSSQVKEQYQIPICNDKILILGDIHAPYHDPEALNLAIQYGKDQKANCIIINGDLFDAHHLSRWEKDPRKRNQGYEIEVAREILYILREAFPKALIVYYLGNHDHRWHRYMKEKAPEILDIPEFDLKNILHLAQLSIIFIDNDRGMKAGKLNIFHGHEFGTAGGVFPARTYYLKAKSNILVSHVHKASEYISKDVDKHIEGGWSTACLCETEPDYMPNNEHINGFAFVTVYKDKSFSVDNKKIIGGQLR